jgi:hypothetical protein
MVANDDGGNVDNARLTDDPLILPNLSLSNESNKLFKSDSVNKDNYTTQHH